MTRNLVTETRDASATLVSDPYAWIEKQTTIKTSAEIEVSATLIDQVIGQDTAVQVAQKAASQKRHLLLIGDPGTGKSMIAKAMSEMLPPEKLDDLLTYHNPKDPNQPQMLTVDAGRGPDVIGQMRRRAMRRKVVMKTVQWVTVALLLGIGLYFFVTEQDVMPFGIMLLVSLFMFMLFRQAKDPVVFAVPKLLLGHDPKKETHAAYVDATGSHAGALLGDVRHDPYQSGGLETPTHERVEVGAIHRAHKGILFIDEINVLRLDSQQALLTAMQDKRYAIVGQSETSSGAMVRTAPVPCDFILVAAGNLDAVQPPDGSHKGMHPALRSRIRGYGYEVYVNSSMPDTHENRLKLCRFVAQEVRRDGRIPHFERDAIAEVILEAQRRSGARGKLTLRLRELGGLVRTAGDIAHTKGAQTVSPEHVRDAKVLSRSLEQQIAESALEARRTSDLPVTAGECVGLAAGAGTVGTGEVGEPAGLVIPIATAVTAALSRSGGRIAIGSGLAEAAPQQAEAAGALVQSIAGAAAGERDMHVQTAVATDGVDATGAGLALAVSALSALDDVPVRQDTALVAAVAVTGALRAVAGVTQAIEMAVEAGYTRAVVAEGNRNDVLLSPAYRPRIEVLFVPDLAGALEACLAGRGKAALVAKVRAATAAASDGAASRAAHGANGSAPNGRNGKAGAGGADGGDGVAAIPGSPTPIVKVGRRTR